jgi:hypothetical protein
MVVKNSNNIQYAFNKPEPDKGLPRFDVVYKMDAWIHTVVETGKELGNTLRDCFEDKNHLTFQVTGQLMLPCILRLVPKRNIN